MSSKPKPLEQFVNCLRMLSGDSWQTEFRDGKITIHNGMMTDERASSHHSGDWMITIQPNLDISNIQYEHYTEICTIDGRILSKDEVENMDESKPYFVQQGLSIDPQQEDFASKSQDFLSKSCVRLLERAENTFPMQAFNRAFQEFSRSRENDQLLG